MRIAISFVWFLVAFTSCRTRLSDGETTTVTAPPAAADDSKDTTADQPLVADLVAQPPPDLATQIVDMVKVADLNLPVDLAQPPLDMAIQIIDLAAPAADLAMTPPDLAVMTDLADPCKGVVGHCDAAEIGGDGGVWREWWVAPTNVNGVCELIAQPFCTDSRCDKGLGCAHDPRG